MPNKIIVIGTPLPHDEVEFVSLHAQNSLLDYDISIFNPNISLFYAYGRDYYLGKPCLDDTNSFKLKEQLSHWRREILGAVRAGKTIDSISTEKDVNLGDIALS